MAAKDNLTKAANITTTVREIDFITNFVRNWENLRRVWGIMRPVKKAPGTKLVSYSASVTLQPGNVGEGEAIPYSLASVSPVYYDDIVLEKYCKAVSLEAVQKHGAVNAITRTDNAFRDQLIANIMNKFYTFLGTGTLTGTEDSFQMAIAMSIGRVKNRFEGSDMPTGRIAVWVNVLDAYTYLGASDLTVQTAFGMDYVENFMGADIMFISAKIPQGKVIATPVGNIVPYYIDPSDDDFRQLGLNFRTDSEIGLIGFHAEPSYNTMVGESYALIGMVLWAEYLDGIAVTTVTGGSVSPKPVYVTGSVATVETDATLLGVIIDKTTVDPSDTNKVAITAAQYNITPATAPSVAYLWQIRAKTGTVWTDLTDSYTGYNTAELTIKAADAEKHYRCKVTASGSAVGTVYSAECTVNAGE